MSKGEWKQDRYISHFVLRSLNPANLAKFYREVYELQELEKPADDPNHYLTDGRVTMIVSPWAITDYEGAGIEPRHMDHLGFRVEDVETFKKDLKAVAAMAAVIMEHQGKRLGAEELERLLGEIEALSDEQAQHLLAEETTTTTEGERHE